MEVSCQYRIGVRIPKSEVPFLVENSELYSTLYSTLYCPMNVMRQLPIFPYSNKKLKLSHLSYSPYQSPKLVFSQSLDYSYHNACPTSSSREFHTVFPSHTSLHRNTVSVESLEVAVIFPSGGHRRLPLPIPWWLISTRFKT